VWVAVVGGVGVVATGVGAALGLSASSKWDDAERACPGNVCTRAADKELGEQAGARADLSTAFFVVGGLGIATAAVILLTAPSGGSKQGVSIAPRIGAGGGGFVIGGAL
jgi:hypothetical protein